MENETLTTEAVMDAYNKLPADERRELNDLADALMTGYHVRTGSRKGFGVKSSVRLLGCVGMLLAKSDYVIRT